MIGSAGAGGPAAIPFSLVSVSSVKLPYERQSFLGNTVLAGFARKHTLPLIECTRGGMRTSGVGAPVRLAEALQRMEASAATAADADEQPHLADMH